MVGLGPRVRIAQTIDEIFLQCRPNSFPVRIPMGAAQRPRRAKRETRGGTREQDGCDYDRCGATSCTWLTSRQKRGLNVTQARLSINRRGLQLDSSRNRRAPDNRHFWPCRQRKEAELLLIQRASRRSTTPRFPELPGRSQRGQTRAVSPTP